MNQNHTHTDNNFVAERRRKHANMPWNKRRYTKYMPLRWYGRVIRVQEVEDVCLRSADCRLVAQCFQKNIIVDTLQVL